MLRGPRPACRPFLKGRGTGYDGNMPEDSAGQARNPFENPQSGLELAGVHFAAVVRTTYFLQDMADLATLREVGPTT